jgi:histone deacetylase 11
MKIIYEPGFNFGIHGIEKHWHPFDTQKYRRAWKRIRVYRPELTERRIRVRQEVSHDDLRLVHDPDYLASLADKRMVSRIVEVPQLGGLPAWLIDRIVLRPMRLQTAGTIAAARAALSEGFVFHVGGGFHHAKPGSGEGFCCYADAAVAVAVLRRDGLLQAFDRIVSVDLDVHMGNGVAHCFAEDRRTFLFDMFNSRIYPALDVSAHVRLDCPLPVKPGCTGDAYLGLLRERLPPFLDSVGRSAPIRLAIFNAGTDVYAEDQLGGLDCSADDILERDMYVVEQLRSRGIATVFVAGGGYSEMCHRLIARSAMEAAARGY